MSIGRPDPNAFKIITPDAYNKNLAEIARARATLEAYEEMNEAGKLNYDRLVEQEERELEQKIQEGLAAKQRLQELRTRRASGLLESSSRIEEVGTTTGYDPVRPPGHSPVAASTSFAQPVPNNFGPQFPANQPTVPNNPATASSYPPQQYPYHAPVSYAPAQPVHNSRPIQSVPQNGSQSASVQRRNANNQTFYRDSASAQSNNIQAHVNTSNDNQFPQSQLSGNPYRPLTQMNPSYHSDAPTQTQSLPSTSQPSTINLQSQPSSQPQVHYQQHQQMPRASNTTSSLINALGTASSSHPSKVPAPAAAPIPPIASSSRSAKSNEDRRSSQKTAPSTGTTEKDPDIIIPIRPTDSQVNMLKGYFGSWAARVHPQSEYNGLITCGKYSITCIKHTDNSVRFLFSLPSGVVHMLVSKFLDGLLSTAAQPIDHPPLDQKTFIPSSSTSQFVTPVQGPTSAGPPTTVDQDVPGPVNSKGKEPLSYGMQDQASTSIPQTPVQRSPVERRVGTITSPKQADKKRIAQSVLFALGKRRRESDIVPESSAQASKKQALAPPVTQKPREIASNAESSEDSATVPLHTAACTNSVEPKPTNAILPETTSTSVVPKPTDTIPAGASSTTVVATPSDSIPPGSPLLTAPAATLPQALPRNDIQPPNNTGVTSQQTSHYPFRVHQYGQMFSSTPQEMQYIKFTPLKPNSAWRPSPAPSSVPPPAHHYHVFKATETVSNSSHYRIPPSSTSNTTVSSTVGDTLKANPLNKKRPGSRTSLQKVRTSQTHVPAPSQSSSSAVYNTSSRSDKDDLIPQITYLKESSRKSPEPVASSSKITPPAEPLFLPSSPSAEPQNDEILDEEVQKSHYWPKVNRAYVLVPPAPAYVARFRQQQQRREQKQKMVEHESFSVSSGIRRMKNGTRTGSSVSTLFGEEDISRSAESQSVSVLEEQEREAIQLACSRLQVVPCRWDGCEAELNSVETLIRHLNLHRLEASQHTKTFMCRWTQCGQQGIKAEDVHIEKHALLPLRCAYLGCDDTFRSPGQLLRHFRTKHSSDELKPAARLALPSTLPDLPPIPGIVPSYLIVTSLAGRQVVSKERHSVIGPQVLKGMTAEQNAPPRRSRKNARPASRASLPVARTDLTNDYNFLENNNSARSSTNFSKASELEHSDLDSESLLKMLEGGKVLLGPEKEEEEEEEEEEDQDGHVDIETISPPSSPLQRRESRGQVNVDPRWPQGPGDAVRQDEHSSDEEAVETMLTEMTLTGTSAL